MARPATRTKRYTYADYLSWDSDERWEFIQGKAYSMVPARALSHQTVSIELATQISLYLRTRPCRVFAAPFDVRLPEGNEPDDEICDVVQPDILVVCDEEKLEEKGCRGAPDWIIEILSPSSAAKDQIQKLQLYEKHSVRQYWLVHPTDRVVTIYTLGKTQCYGRPQIQETNGKTRSGLFEDLDIDWDLVFGAVPRAHG